MILFCPTCANVLMVEEGISSRLRYACNTCPYVYYINKKLRHRTYPKLKELDFVIGGASAWENVDSTSVVCPKCAHGTAFFMQLQIRSADEPMTTFYRCCNHSCAHNWRD
ncbi:RNA polymerase III subunit K [Arctopsyche grandis]|uniref:RNA polymerase III subunit K n=1 Tax=Arctopsyche grandis TaxID=121162 RepID=UPI00406D9BB9